MIKKYRNLEKNCKFNNRIEILCSFNRAKYIYIQGSINKINGVNLIIIEPHKYIIELNSKKIIVLYFNDNNIFLYSRRMPITFKQLELILKEMRNINYE